MNDTGKASVMTNTDVVSVREFVETILHERDRLYGARFDASQTAVSAALAAQKELVQAAFAASEKAIVKAEAAQTSYNSTHNDISRKMDGQYANMLPRTEAHAVMDALREKVNALEVALKEKMSALDKIHAVGVGKTEGLNAGWGYLVGGIGIALAVYSALRGSL